MLCYRCGSYTPDGSRKCEVCGQPLSSDKRQPTRMGPIGLTTGVTRAPLKTGTVVSERYRIIEGGESGTTGWVLRAQDQQSDSEVALKLIHANLLQTEAERASFEKAIKRAEKLHHPNLARVLGSGRDGMQLFYTMPYFEGLTLSKVIDLRLEKDERFRLDEILPLFGQLAVALDYLSKGGHHGALRPSNIIVLPDVLKVTGVAHLRGLPRRPFVMLLTEQGDADYLAPEARREDGKVTVASDIYSMAVIVTEMLTGEVYGRDMGAWDEAKQELPSRLLAVLQRALADEVDERHDSASAFYAELAAAAASRGVVIGGQPPPMILEAEATAVDPKALAAQPDEKARKPKRQPALMSEPALEIPSRVEAPAEAGNKKRRTVRVRRRIGSQAPSQRVLYLASAIMVLGLAVSGFLWWRGRASQPAQQATGTVPTLPPVQAPPAGEARNQVVLQPRPIAPPESRVQAADDGDRRGRTAPEPTLEASPRLSPSARRRGRAVDRAVERIAERERERERPARDVPEETREPSLPPPPAPPPPTREPVATPPRVVTPPAVAQTPPRQAPAAEPVVETPAGKCPAGMAYVASGSFVMGSALDDANRGMGELPAMRKRTDAFCIDRYEQPNQAGKVPTTSIDWEAAERACDNEGKRLCTEAEWERACKGPQGRAYPYGDELQAGTCNIGESGSRQPSGSARGCRSSYGVFDLTGNVAEWTSSQAGGSIANKIVKGGAAGQPNFAGRCSARASESSRSRQLLIGFRCCADTD